MSWRFDLSIDECAGGTRRHAGRRSRGGEDPRPDDLVAEIEDPRPDDLVAEIEDPRPDDLVAEIEDPRPDDLVAEIEDPDAAGRRIAHRDPRREEYSGHVVVRLAERCAEPCADGERREPQAGEASPAGSEKLGTGAPARRQGPSKHGVEKAPRTPPETLPPTAPEAPPASGVPEDPVDPHCCPRLRAYLQDEAELLACLLSPPGEGDPCREALAERLRALPVRPLVRSVTPATIRELETLALATGLPPRASLAAYCRIDACALPLSLTRRLVAILDELPWVDLAYLELAATDPQRDPRLPASFSGGQGYLDRAPLGLGVRAAQEGAGEGALGEGVTVVDLEQGWRLDHVDLSRPDPDAPALPGPLYGDNRAELDASYRGDHGTAVLGELGAVRDERGVDGIVPRARLLVASHFDRETGSNGHVADALVAVVAALAGRPLARGGPAPSGLARGDVVLVEVQRSRKPAEIDHADFDAIRLASALGLLVVEAAGNGGFDLDRYRDERGRGILDRGGGTWRESGALLVGAAEPDPPHDRARFSCFGSRVDCYAWGRGVVTSGYGDLAGSPGGADAFTAEFAGTSSAAPMVAGVAAAVQGAVRTDGEGMVLAPFALRRLLADPATGTPQGRGRRGAVGVMPDLAAVFGRGLAAPTPRLRRFPGDELGGATAFGRSAGPTSSSPDLVIDERGLSLRAVNAGLGTASGFNATVFRGPLAPLLRPDALERLATVALPDLPQGQDPEAAAAVLAVAGAGDRASYVAVLHRDDEPPSLPAGPPYFRFADLLDFHRRHARRSRVELGREGDAAISELEIVGAPDRPRRFECALEQRLPAPARVGIEVPLALAAELRRAGLEPAGEAVERSLGSGGDSIRLELVPFLLPPLPRLALGAPLLDGTVYPCRIAIFDVPDGETAAVSLVQRFRGVELGRVTWTA